MARSRMIKPEFFDDPDIGELSPLARLFFIGMWTHADREGRLIDDMRVLKARLFPYDNVDLEALAVELNGKDMIRRYQAGEKHGFIWIRNFLKHQHPHPKESQSLIPPCAASAGKLHYEPCKAMEGSPCSTSTSTSTSTSNSNSLDREITRHEAADLETTKTPEFHFDEAFEHLRDDYPPERRQDSVPIRQDFIHAFDGRINGQREALFDEMLIALAQHMRSEQWRNSKHIPMFGKWISERRWIQRLTEAANSPHTPATDFLTWFTAEYAANRHGAVYFISTDKHAPIVSRLLKQHALERLKQHAQILLTTDEDWVETTDRGIEVLATKINWLEDRLSQWEAKKHAHG